MHMEGPDGQALVDPETETVAEGVESSLTRSSGKNGA